MKLVSETDETVTIQFERRTEFARLLAVLPAVAQEFERLDAEIMGLTRDEVVEVSEKLFRL